MIRILVDAKKDKNKIEIEMDGMRDELLEEAGNAILEMINNTSETMEERHAFGVLLLSAVVGTFMQEQVDGEYDEEKAEELINSAFKFIITNIKLNKNKDKLLDLIGEALFGINPEEAGEAEPTEPAQEEAAEAEGK